MSLDIGIFLILVVLLMLQDPFVILLSSDFYLSYPEQIRQVHVKLHLSGNENNLIQMGRLLDESRPCLKMLSLKRDSDDLELKIALFEIPDPHETEQNLSFSIPGLISNPKVQLIWLWPFNKLIAPYWQVWNEARDRLEPHQSLLRKYELLEKRAIRLEQALMLIKENCHIYNKVSFEEAFSISCGTHIPMKDQ